MNSEINKIGIISGSLGITAETEQPTPPEEAK
jgi:hypothetical protein